MVKMRVSVLMVLAAIMGIIPQARADTSLSQSATQFVKQFWLAWSGPSPISLTYVEFAVTDPLDFYGKPISRDAYMKVQRAFVERWPVREYSISPDSEQVTCNEKKLTCEVNGALSWRNFDPHRRVTSTGTGTFGFDLKELTDQNGHLTGFAIDAITGSVTDRNLLNAPPASAVIRAASLGGNFARLSQDNNDSGQNIIVSDAALQNAGCASADGEELLHQGCTSVAELDLTTAFHTREKTIFEVVQASFDESEDFPTGLNFCFFQREKATCQYDSEGDFGWPNQFNGATIIYPKAGVYYPLLQARLYAAGGFGCGGLFNFIWGYDPAADNFSLVWMRPYDCHTALRFETRGALAGDMVAVDDDVTGRWPWPYGIEVYRFVPPAKLIKILDIVGRAGQGGKYVSGPNDAIDIDMPEILNGLGVAKSPSKK